MSGHSKWSTIKHKKAKEDSKRGKVFTKLIKEITVAAKIGGGDPDGNPKLRLLLEKAKEINMPLENSQRAIKRGTGALPGQHYEQFFYEGYGPGGIAIIIEMLTDNKNKAIAELRALSSRRGGTIAEGGAVSWLFERLGVLRGPKEKLTEDYLLENLYDYDIKSASLSDNLYEVTCDPKILDIVKQKLNSLSIKVEHAELEFVPKELVQLSGENEEKAHEFLSALDDLDDVQNIYTNLD